MGYAITTKKGIDETKTVGSLGARLGLYGRALEKRGRERKRSGETLQLDTGSTWTKERIGDTNRREELAMASQSRICG